MRAIITVQEDQFSIAKLKELEVIVHGLYAKHVSDEKLTVVWNVAGAGLAFTNRQPSRSSLVTFETPDGLPEDKREALLSACDKEWRALTNQHPDQVMVAAFDQALYSKIFKGNLERLSPLGRIVFQLKTMGRLLRSKMQHNLLITSFNL